MLGSCSMRCGCAGYRRPGCLLLAGPPCAVGLHGWGQLGATLGSLGWAIFKQGAKPAHPSLRTSQKGFIDILTLLRSTPVCGREGRVQATELAAASTLGQETAVAMASAARRSPCLVLP